MHTPALLTLLTSLLAFTYAAPAETQAEGIATLEVRITNWKASGGCRSDWRNRCYEACVSEKRAHDCGSGGVSSSIDSGSCSLADRVRLRSHCKCSC